MFDTFTRTDIEQCGILVSDDGGQTFTVVEMPNRHPDPANYFQVHWNDYDRWATKHPGHTVIGFFHTHLPHESDAPSGMDIDQMARYPDLWGVVLHVGTRTVTWFDHTGVIDRDTG